MAIFLYASFSSETFGHEMSTYPMNYVAFFQHLTDYVCSLVLILSLTFDNKRFVVLFYND